MHKVIDLFLARGLLAIKKRPLSAHKLAVYRYPKMHDGGRLLAVSDFKKGIAFAHFR